MTKVLIVDDAVFIRIQLRNLLESNGFEVVAEAENGKVALEKIREFRPDLVTLDITMPEMNGLECMKEIKKMDFVPTVIMVSALGQEKHVQQAILNGAKGFIVKPYKNESVIKNLNKYKD
ncbi:response regulator [Acetobacterium tundrae]|uniref:Stage 0 sporulation protein A homolog n=1 Tax=Acetobacterium tundrae TaxID=132932 RepID=A0ABR6WN43_9FIRM|nr:response regulator [Acetobacterium tundrae]MBC3797706.1 response regulator [Acetobacterium tundrae]